VRRATPCLPEELQAGLGPLLATIAGLDAGIEAYATEIERVAKERYPQSALLRQIPGVGPLTAACFVLTIEDPTRFARSGSVASYLGLRPRRDQSGSMSRQLRITKCGDSDLRRLLVLSAHYILGPFGPDSDLRRWGLALAERGGKNAKKRAAVAVARKLAVLLLRLWLTGEAYEPLRQARRRGEAVAQAA